MESLFFDYKSSRIHYLKSGQGARLLLCFHGYGEDAGSYEILAKPTTDWFTMICIDLPFHGLTDWKDGLVFASKDLLNILEGIASFHRLPFGYLTLAGFSLGGRMAISLVPLIQEKISKLVLLAPDGLKVNFWYWLATQNRTGNSIFRYTMKHPGWFMAVLRSGNRLGMVNRSIYKFSMSYLGDPEARNNLYLRWTSLSSIGCEPAILQRHISESKIALDIVYGEYDRIIRPDTGRKFIEGLDSTCRITVLPGGHQLLNEGNLQAILSVLEP